MFKFKGISSKDMKVVIEEEEHFLARAAQKYDTFSIDGMDGDIIETYGYSNVERPMKVQIIDPSKLDDIFAWLNGKGEFEYNNRVTTAYFHQMLEPIRSSSIKIIDLMFTREPFWYKKDDSFEIVNNSIINTGNIYSYPIIRLEKGTESEVDIAIANIRFTYEFGDNENYVEIDCKTMNAYYNSLLRNRNLKIGYQYPVIYPGANPIIIHSGDPIIKIKRKDCWL